MEVTTALDHSAAVEDLQHSGRSESALLYSSQHGHDVAVDERPPSRGLRVPWWTRQSHSRRTCIVRLSGHSPSRFCFTSWWTRSSSLIRLTPTCLAARGSWIGKGSDGSKAWLVGLKSGSVFENAGCRSLRQWAARLVEHRSPRGRAERGRAQRFTDGGVFRREAGAVSPAARSRRRAARQGMF